MEIGITFEINRPIYDQDKRINSIQLKVGDRFIYEGCETLVFKTNKKPQDGNYLCCNEIGELIWIDGEAKVKRLNGVVYELAGISKNYIEYFQNRE